MWIPYMSDAPTARVRGRIRLEAPSASPETSIDAPLDRPRGRPVQRGTSGNPAGRPAGSRNRTTLAVQALLDGEAEALTRKAIELASNGDLNALRLCLDRVIPIRRDQPLPTFEMTKL